MASAHIDKGRLSFCFISLGNSITGLLSLLPGLFGTVRVCSGDFHYCSEDCRCLGALCGLLGFCSEDFRDCSGESFNMAVFDDRMRFAGEP